MDTRTSEVNITDTNQVLAFRLANQHLTARIPQGASFQTASIGCIQNTPPGSAELALNARLAGLCAGASSKMLETEKTLLQAWSLRASPHIFPIEFAEIFTFGLLPNNEVGIRCFIRGVVPALDKIGISAVEVVELTSDAVFDLLNNRSLTKDELGLASSEWIRPHLSAGQQDAWRQPSWYAPKQSLGESVVRFAFPIVSLRGICCHGERRNNKAYLVRIDQWLRRPNPEVNLEHVQAELIRRYLHCYGPSTVEHFAEWAGIGTAQANQAWKLVEPELSAVKFFNRKTWLLRNDTQLILSPPVPHGTRFLPPGDPYLALRDRNTLIADKKLQQLIWQKSGNPGLLLLDGVASALWRPSKKGTRLSINIEPFISIPRSAHPSIEMEAEMIAVLKECGSHEVKFLNNL